MLSSNPVESTDNFSEDSWVTLLPSKTSINNLVGDIIGASAINDKIYLIATQVCGVYDFNKNSWEPISSPEQYPSGVVVACQNKIYVIGKPTQVYDPLTDNWKIIAEIPQVLNGQKAVTVENKIYVIGGKNPSPISIVYPSDQIFVYDITTDFWSNMEHVPLPVAGSVCVVSDAKIFVIGGGVGTSVPENATNVVQVFDTKTNNWSNAEALPTGVIYSKGFSTDGTFAPEQIYVIGGSLRYDGGGLMSGSSSERSKVNLNQVYDVKTVKWSLASPLPEINSSYVSANSNDLLYLVTSNLEVLMYIPKGYQTNALNNFLVNEKPNELPFWSKQEGQIIITFIMLLIATIIVALTIYSIKRRKYSIANQRILD